MKTAKPLPVGKHLGFETFCLGPQHCVYFTHMRTHIPRYNSRVISQANRSGQGVKESIRIANLIETELTKGEIILCTQVSNVQEVYQTDGVNVKVQPTSLKVLTHIGS